MTKKFLAALLVLTFAFTLRLPALAQDKADNSTPAVQDWQGLRELKPGKVIVVYTKQGKEFEGKFVDIKGSTLGLALGFDIWDFEQNEIAEAYQKPRHKRRGRIIGAVIGTLVGGMLSAYVGLRMEANSPPGAESPAGAITGLGVFGGGGLGYAIGLHFDNKRKGKLLYKSR